MYDPDEGYMSQEEFDAIDQDVCENEIGMSVDEADSRDVDDGWL